jgi:hypothetical protein
MYVGFPAQYIIYADYIFYADASRFLPVTLRACGNSSYHDARGNILQKRAPVITNPSSTHVPQAVETRGCITTGVLIADHAPTMLSKVAMVPPPFKFVCARVSEDHTTLRVLSGALAAFPRTDYDLVTVCTPRAGAP